MVLARSTAFSTSCRTVFARPAGALRTAGPQPWRRIAQHTARRGYASATGGAMKKAGSDLPWLIGAVAVTIPSCIYLIQPSSDSHGHHGADAHETRHEPGKQTIADKNENVSEEEGKRDLGPSGSTDKDPEQLEKPHNETQNENEPPSMDEEHVVDTPENKGDPDGVQFKGKTNQGDADMQAEDVRKHVPDAKGGAKKRIESTYGNKLGAAEPVREGEVGKNKDKAQASKESLDQNHMSGKQSGLSNTDTKHSIDITQDPTKSKKGEGAPDTAKLQGPVDPRRPQAESPDRDDQEKA